MALYRRQPNHAGGVAEANAARGHYHNHVVLRRAGCRIDHGFPVSGLQENGRWQQWPARGTDRRGQQRAGRDTRCRAGPRNQATTGTRISLPAIEHQPVADSRGDGSHDNGRLPG